ncbi:MAG TPA: hypothetical protein VH186_19465 [Chloroflexia bacterium]|nr:hypothetical protein [Chloroflexia bacterium]
MVNSSSLKNTLQSTGDKPPAVLTEGLKKVAKLFAANPEFRRSLMANPIAAISEHNLSCTVEDIKVVESFLSTISVYIDPTYNSPIEQDLVEEWGWWQPT